MRRVASLAGVSLIAGGVTALMLFASAARGAPLDLPLLGSNDNISIQDNGSNGSGSETTVTTIDGNGSGNGSGVTTSTSPPTTVSSGTSNPLPRTDGPTTQTQTTTCSPPRISSSVQSVVRGGLTGVAGSCFGAGTDIAFTLFSDPVSLGTSRTDGNGNFSVTVQIPKSVPVGTHTLTASGGGLTASVTLVVSEALSRTGMSWNLAILGLALIAAGIIVMAGDRIGRQELIEFA